MKQDRLGKPILLAHSYFLRYDEKQWRRMEPYPPLATLIVAGELGKRGHDVRFFDAMLADGVDDFFDCLRQHQPSVVILVEDNFNFLTKMCTTRMRDAALDMIRAAKAMGAQVAVNGSDATDNEDTYLSAGADVIALGEPEETILALLDTWDKSDVSPPYTIQGVAFHSSTSNGGQPVLERTPSRPFIRNLDALSFPAWNLIDLERYRRAWKDAHGRFSWNMVTSRGCPYKCNWCAKPVFGTRYAQRAPADVAEEMRQLLVDVAPDHVWFADDIFGLTATWIRAFAEEVRARNARISFTMQSRPNLMKTAVVAALAEAGAETVWLGVESGSQQILDAMDKGTTVDQISSATRNLRAVGIRACWFIQLGYIGETWSDIMLTRYLIRAERPDDIGVSVSYPLPGTKFFELVRDQLGDKTNWSDSNDLAMMFRGSYQTSFYRTIRSLLHDEADAAPQPTADAQAALNQRWEELECAEPDNRCSALDELGSAV